MNLVVDMNLSPQLCDLLRTDGWKAIHWSDVGSPSAPDEEIMKWAMENEHVVVTHDLDFGSILAATNAGGPSVIQVRTQNVMPDHIHPILVSALRQFHSELESGALIVVDEGRRRARILPLNVSDDE